MSHERRTDALASHVEGRDCSRGAKEAGEYLRRLLQQAPYRRLWERRAQRVRGAQVNQAAVAQVLAEYLWESAQRSEGDVDLPRKLKDRVMRSLSGKALTPETLNWFIEAFSMLGADKERLWALLEVSEQIRVITGELPIVSADLGLPKHETSLLHEFHYVGADGVPCEHRTVQVIRSLVNGLAGYPYRFDTNAVTVEVLRGGRVGPLYKISDTLYAVDILFTRPLQVGETASMEYRTTFRYEEPPSTDFRRGARKRVENLEVRVEFHMDKLPRSIWWTIWASVEGPVILKERVSLDDEHAVHRYLEAIESTVVGFSWEW